MRDFRKLDVWAKGREFAVAAYHLTKEFPREEQFGLVSQIRRAAVSVPTNIAEGAGRSSDGDFLRFLRISIGSLNEVETLILISEDLALLSESQAGAFLDRTRDLAVRLRNLSARIESDLGKSRHVREEIAPYDTDSMSN